MSPDETLSVVESISPLTTGTKMAASESLAAFNVDSISTRHDVLFDRTVRLLVSGRLLIELTNGGGNDLTGSRFTAQNEANITVMKGRNCKRKFNVNIWNPEKLSKAWTYKLCILVRRYTSNRQRRVVFAARRSGSF